MNARRASVLALAVVIGAGLATSAAAERLPEWLEAARTVASPPASATLHAHALLRETRVTLSEKGRMRTRERGVIRVLDAQGADEATVTVPYDRKSAKVELKGWVMDPFGNVKSLGRKDAVEGQLEDTGTFQTDLRRWVLFAADPKAGLVFAWESEVEEEALFADLRTWLDSDLPCALERFEIELPANVTPRIVALGTAQAEGVRDGNVWRWERRDVPAHPDEPWSAASASWRDGLVVGPRAADGTPGVAGAAFAGWGDASRWLHEISDPSVVPTPAITARAHAIAGGATAPLEQARALGRYVQSLNYLHVAVGLAHGDGYRPHAAEDVLRLGYGDCKDKAALFCSLARSLGMEAWLASASLDGRDAVQRAWASPGQFDHCIAALRVPAGTPLAAVSSEGSLGPLLFFDPTDPNTPFGTLPGSLAGSYVLLIHPQQGELLRLPTPGGRPAPTESALDAAVDENGALRGRWRLLARGADAQNQRAWYQRSATRWREALERDFVEWLGPCELSAIETKDLPDSDAFRISLEIAAPRFGKALGARLMALRASPRLATGGWRTADTTRRTPIALPLLERVEEVTLALPLGWSISERPSDVAREYDFGRIRSEWQATGNSVRLRFHAHVEPVTLPRMRYHEWTALLGEWTRASRAQVVVARP